VVQIEGLGVPGLLLKIILQLTPFPEIPDALAAMDGRVFFRVVRDVHQDFPAGFTIKSVVEALAVHRCWRPHSVTYFLSAWLPIVRPLRR